MNPSSLTGCKKSPFTKLPQSQNPTGSNTEGTKTAPHLPPHHSHPAAPESLPTCTLPRVGHPVTLPPFLSPLLKATSSQAPHPSSPRQLYQSQLWVCADLFLIAGAWFTLAPPPNIDSIIWRVTDVRDLDGCQDRLLSGPGPGPSPHPAISRRGPERPAHGPRSHDICPQRLGSSYLSGTTMSPFLLGQGSSTEAWGSEVRWGRIKRAVEEMHWDSGCKEEL